MRFTCPSCAKSYRLPPERLGPAGRAQISCPNCKAVVLVKTGQDENLICQLLGPGAAPEGASPSATANPARTSAAIPAAVPPTWFVVVDREKVGPLTPAQIAEKLATGALTIHSLAWQKGMAGWTKIEELPELLKDLARTGQVAHARQSGAVAPQPAAGQPAAPVPAATHSAPHPVAAASAPHPATHPGTHPATQAAPHPATQPPPHPATQPAPHPATQPAPQAAAAKSGPQPIAARTSQPAPAARPVAARPPMPLPTANEDDGSGPTLEAAIPLPAGRPEPKAPAKPPAPAPIAPSKSPSTAKAHHDAHGEDFFGKHDLGDVDFALPDPNKHKPTKEEYQNLIQEFSVMFRLDKRTKRQKVLIAVVLASLLVGAISFGVVLAVGASKKKQLIRDSKEILALFDLGYKQAVTPAVSGDNGDAAAAGDAKAAGAAGSAGTAAAKKAEPAKVSMIADKLLGNVVKKRKDTKPVGATSMAQRGQVDAAKEAADLAAQEDKRRAEAQKKAAELAAKYGVVGKVENQVGGAGSLGEELSQKEVTKTCNEAEGQLRVCGKKNDAEAGYKLKITVVTSGKVDNVVALVDGKPNSALSQCAKNVLGAKRLNAPKATTTYDCKVD